jgi:catalase
MFANVDPELAKRMAAGIGAKAPSGVKPGKKGKVSKSPGLSQENTVKDTIKSRRIAILADDGVDAATLTLVKKILMDQGAHFKVVSERQGMLKGEGGKGVEADKSFETTASVMFDAVFVPGGMKSVESLKRQGSAIHFINEAFKHCKPIGAIGEGVELLAASDIKGVKLAGQGPKGSTVSDKGVVTAPSGADAKAFSAKFFDAIARHRHWDRDKKDEVPA